MNRMLNINYAIEVIEGRINGSAKEVETNKNLNKNTVYTKKIGGRAKVSSVCQKASMWNYLGEVLGEDVNKVFKNIKDKKNKNRYVYDPYTYMYYDIRGYMQPSENTIRRKARLQMSSLVNVSNRKVEDNWHTCDEMTDTNGVHIIETYSGIMSGIANLNISKVGEFEILDEKSKVNEFFDYTKKEALALGVRNLTKEEKFERVEKVLKALEYMSIKGNQTNHLTDTKPKFIIMADYGWGNNVFQGIINKNGLDIEMLKEAITQNEEYRLSNIYIGVNKFFDKNNNLDIEVIKQELEDYDFIKVDNVHNTFKNYLEELKVNI